MREFANALAPFAVSGRARAAAPAPVAPEPQQKGELAELRKMSTFFPTPTPPVATKWLNRTALPWIIGAIALTAVVTVVALALSSNKPYVPAPPTSTEPTLEQLVSGLKSTDAAKRLDAAKAIRSRKLKEAARDLAGRVFDDFWTVTNTRDRADDSKVEALEGLKELAPEEVPKALTNALRSRTAEVRSWACYEIFRWREDERFVEPMIRTLSDENPRIRKLSAEKLRRLYKVHPDDAIIRALATRIADDLWEDEPAGGSVLDPRGDPMHGGKKSALEALREISNAEARRALEKAKTSPRKQVADWAAEELDAKP
jgi:hypothetical protein